MKSRVQELPKLHGAASESTVLRRAGFAKLAQHSQKLLSNQSPQRILPIFRRLDGRAVST